MVAIDELPPGAGLIEEREEGRFAVVKRAKKQGNRKPFTTRQWMNLVLKPHEKPVL